MPSGQKHTVVSMHEGSKDVHVVALGGLWTRFALSTRLDDEDEVGHSMAV